MHRPGTRLVEAAAAAGLVHAGWSLYWALGGTALLDTVGQWAVEWRAREPLLTTVVLLAVGAAKVAGAVVPVLNHRGRLPRPEGWRAASWVGAVVLVGWGGLNTVVGAAVLAGLVDPVGPTDRPGLVGHALLWDPLFLLWGVLLGAGLWASRPHAGPTR